MALDRTREIHERRMGRASFSVFRGLSSYEVFSYTVLG